MSKHRVLRRVLVANRGEIARRLLRGLRALGKQTVAVCSEADRAAPFLHGADRIVEIGAGPPRESYLRGDRIIEAARASGADAVHPGYGFLSENAEFAAAVEAAGLVFIGPTADSIRTMGDKTRAGDLARAAGVPTVPGFTPAPGLDARQLEQHARQVGLPLMVKAAAGGGGKGMRIARQLDELAEHVEAAAREAVGAFGDGRIFLERYVEHARHVEVQVLGDGRGEALTLGVRDCSVQRRHQKLIEETPAPFLAEATRRALCEAARALVERARYRGAGTIEFILAPGEQFYFLEMNTRLQVEHPVTELVHGVDLLALQVAVAEHRPWPSTLAEAPPRGHALEVRVYAENPGAGFLPSTGTLSEVVWPAGPGVRVDAGFERGNEVSPLYDPLLAKIIVHDTDREAAIERMRGALGETFVAGVSTTVEFCRALLDHEDFRAGRIYTTMLAERWADWRPPAPPPAVAAAAAFYRQYLVGTNRGAAGRAGDSESHLPSVWDRYAGWRLP